LTGESAITHPRIFATIPTTAPTEALSFYEKVVGFSHRSMDLGSGQKYHILSRDGVDGGGVTGHGLAGAPPHRLPYVVIDDVDATIARARKRGARIPAGPEDIPGIGRFGVLEDPTGAVLAIMKPLPREKQP
jgi:predicted enzyme related to lactoylglutathione lyase